MVHDFEIAYKLLVIHQFCGYISKSTDSLEFLPRHSALTDSGMAFCANAWSQLSLKSCKRRISWSALLFDDFHWSIGNNSLLSIIRQIA